MVKVFLTCTDPRPSDGYHSLLESAEKDKFGEHRITHDPAEADLILFVENWEADWLHANVRRDPLLKKFRHKCFVIAEEDESCHLLPGVYSNACSRELLVSRVRSGCYLYKYENPHITFRPVSEQYRWLFSFVGSFDTAHVRANLSRLSHPRGYVQDTSDKSKSVWWNGTEETKSAFQKEYAETMAESIFVLCPRGYSPSTVRLFEAMKMGRVPVIISDSWVPPEGPDWSACSIRIKERDILHVDSLLEEREHSALDMASSARREWENWFSPSVSFHRTVEWCLSIQRSRVVPENVAFWLKHLSLVGPRHRKHTLRTIFPRN